MSTSHPSSRNLAARGLAWIIVGALSAALFAACGDPSDTAEVDQGDSLEVIVQNLAGSTGHFHLDNQSFAPGDVDGPFSIRQGEATFNVSGITSGAYSLFCVGYNEILARDFMSLTPELVSFANLYSLAGFGLKSFVLQGGRANQIGVVGQVAVPGDAKVTMNNYLLNPFYTFDPFKTFGGHPTGQNIIALYFDDFGANTELVMELLTQRAGFAIGTDLPDVTRGESWSDFIQGDPQLVNVTTDGNGDAIVYVFVRPGTSSGSAGVRVFADGNQVAQPTFFVGVAAEFDATVQ